MAILALGNIVVRIGRLKVFRRKRPDARCTALLRIGRKHELGECPLYMEIRKRGIHFRRQWLSWIGSQVCQNWIGNVMAGVAKVLAFVEAGIKHLVTGFCIGEGGALLAVLADEILASGILCVR